MPTRAGPEVTFNGWNMSNNSIEYEEGKDDGIKKNSALHEDLGSDYIRVDSKGIKLLGKSTMTLKIK